MIRTILACLVVGLLATACTVGMYDKRLLAEASIDLDCPKEQLKIFGKSRTTIKRVKGCGHDVWYELINEVWRIRKKEPKHTQM